MIKENLAEVEQRIQAACERAGRNRNEVQLIAVSKTKPVSMIEEAREYGIRSFGENKVQELMEKAPQFPADTDWHFIGHLQTNKVKYIAENVSLIHSVDSVKLAKTIDKEARKCGRVIPVLIEVNIAKEESKFGVFPEDVPAFVEEIAGLEHMRIEGLMTVAPFVENAEDNRVHFQNLMKLYVDIKSKNIDNVNMYTLSMGMTGDYEVAIEEGATMVRVGTGIFGERAYTIK